MSEPEFAIGQAWRFDSAPNDEALLIIVRIEPRGGRSVVHASIVHIAPPPESEALIAWMMNESPSAQDGDTAASQPSQIFISDVGGTILLDRVTGEASVPHIALYEDDLRATVRELVGTGRTPSDHFMSQYELWRETERSWPEHNDSELAKSLQQRVHHSIRQIPDLVEAMSRDTESQP